MNDSHRDSTSRSSLDLGSVVSSSNSASVEWRKEEIRKSQRDRVAQRKNRSALKGKEKSLSHNWKKLASSIGASVGSAGSTLSASVASSSRSLSSRNVNLSEPHGPQSFSSHSTPTSKSKRSALLSSQSMHGGRGGSNGSQRRGSMGDNLKKSLHGAGRAMNRNMNMSKSTHNIHANNGGLPTGILSMSHMGTGSPSSSSHNTFTTSSSTSKKQSEITDLQQHINALSRENQELVGDAQDLLDENEYLQKELNVSCNKQQKAHDAHVVQEEKLLQSQELLMQFLMNTASITCADTPENEQVVATCSAKHMQRLREEAQVFLNENEMTEQG